MIIKMCSVTSVVQVTPGFKKNNEFFYTEHKKLNIKYFD